MRTDMHVEKNSRTEKRSLLRWIEVAGLLLATCAAGMASANTTPGLDEAGLATTHVSMQLAAVGLDHRADGAASDSRPDGNGIQAAALQGQTADAPRTNVRVMWLAGLALILYQLYRKQRSLEQQPVA